MTWLALSCLQGRMSREAVLELLRFEPEGIQLTPGNIPEVDFEEWFRGENIPFMLHHGFDWEYRKRRVWEGSSCTALEGASIHPPIHPEEYDWMGCGHVLEVMYGDYGLGNGDEVESAMNSGLRLAVDVSHVYIQLMQGQMELGTWFRLQDYDNIAEIHVSANEGKHDVHQALTEKTFGLAWAKEKKEAGTPVVLECYMHKLSPSERMRQMEFMR